MSTVIAGIDPMDFSNDPLLAKMQGNILKGHGRDYTTHIILRFKEKRAATAKAWIGIYLAEKVTSFKTQLRERERFKRNRVPGGLFTAFFLSAEGYRYLGYNGGVFGDEAFKEGMKNRLGENNDPRPDKWEHAYQEEIHAMVLLAEDDMQRLELATKEIMELTHDFATVIAVECGNVIRNENGDGIEHFGYVDGVSQPLFLKDEIDEYMKFHNVDVKNGKVVKEKLKFNPAADKNLVMINDPCINDRDAWGSYFVFRKLEQNVKGFKEAEEALGLDELAGAYLVGRFEDGSPVTLTGDEGVIGAGNYNNFNYDHDPSGGRCPHFAHIRKTNPRTVIANADKKIPPVMARRGIPYGKQIGHQGVGPEKFPEKEVGLLFMSYQSSIEKQFEFIQKEMANKQDFPANTNTGVDAIIGQVAGQDQAKHTYKFPAEYGNTQDTKPITFKQFVTMKGGEYFFAPSIPFLKSLKP